MKKIKSLLTIASILGVGAATALTSPKDYTIENNDQKVYIVSVAGDIAHDNVNAIKNRNTVLNQLDYLVGNENYEITNTYDTLINGFAIKTYDSIADVISKISGVASVAESKGYARPTADQASALGTGELTEDEIKAMKFENYSAESMSATSEDVKAVLAANGAATEESKGGKGVTVGIMDTGLYLNQVEGTAQRTSAGSKASNSAAFVDSEDVVDVLSAEKVAAVKTKLNGKTGVRINKKVAFAFDYADDDNNVDPTGGSAASEHGTHVASLAAANGEDFQGVAPNAQLAIFKVFNNNNSGAYDADIIEALEDAAKLGIDTVNLSLGSPLDESSDNVSDATNVAIKACADAGVIVNYAAGNDGKGSFTGTKGYGDWTTDVVETGILGNSSLTDEYANIVAATANDRAFYDSIMLVRGEGEGAADIAVSYDDQVVNKTGSSIHYDTEHKFTDLITGSDLDYVYVGGFGTESDYSGLDCQGKVVVVNRGDLTFYNKYVYAQKAGASGLIVVNNNSSTTFNFSFDFNDHNPEFPIVSVFQSMGDVFKAGAGTDRYGKLSLATNVQEDAPDGHTMSSFSSDGSSANLDLVPTISAPGSDIMGAVEATTVGENSGLTGYDNMSGTSMATPNLTGAIALALGEKVPGNGTLSVADDTVFAAYKNKVSKIAMSTTSKIHDGADVTASPRRQGAGQIDVKNLLMADTYLTTVDQDPEGFYADGTEIAKAELKNSGSLNVEDLSKDEAAYVEFEYKVHNDSSMSRTYKPTLEVLIPKIEVMETLAKYNQDKDDATLVADIPANLPSTLTMSIDDDEVAAAIDAGSNISVAAGATVTGNVKVRIDDLSFSKEFEDVENPDFTGTLREYFNKYFSDAGGSYVEGYLNLEDITDDSDEANDANLSMAYMGFYGDFTKGAAVEDFDFEQKTGHLYTSQMIDSYMKNLSNASYVKANAYTGSTISGVGTAPSASDINSIGSMTTSALAGSSSKYASVTDFDEPAAGENKRLYAGSASSKKLLVTTFVNRSIAKGTWSITQNGSSKKNGNFSDLYAWGSSFSAIDDGGALRKSWLVTGTSYQLHRGYALIDVDSLAEGTDYSLNFSFTLEGTGTTQTKSYPLTVDKTAPTVVSAEITESGSNKYLHLVTNGANNTIGSSVPTAVSGSDGYYEASIRLRDSQLETTQAITLTDYANNATTVLINPGDLSFFASGSALTSKYELYIDFHRNRSGYAYYYFSILNASGNFVKLSTTYTIYFNIGTGLNADDVDILIDSEEATFTYDSTTGYVALTIPTTADDGSEFAVNYTVGGQGDTPGASTSTSTSTFTSTSTSTSTSTFTSTSTSTGGGCFNSGNMDANTLADSFFATMGLAGLAYFFFVKKRRF